MTKEQLEALKKITPGPYEASVNGVFKRVSPNFATCLAETEGENRYVMAQAFAALPDLIAERERMIALLKNLRAVTEIYGWALAHSEELTNQALKQMELKGIGSRGVEADALIAEAEGGE